jgi:predicted RNA-binding protein
MQFLAITKEEHFREIVNNSCYFLNDHWVKKIKNLKPGDKVYFYLKEKQKIVGDCVIEGPANMTPIYARIKISNIHKYEHDIDFKQLIHRLQFIKDKKHWGPYLQVPLRTLKDEDQETLKIATANL